MKTWKKIMAVFCGIALVVSLSACEKEGPAEKAGKKVDESMEKSQQMMEDAGEKTEEMVEEAGEKVEEAGEKMQGQ